MRAAESEKSAPFVPALSMPRASQTSRYPPSWLMIPLMGCSESSFDARAMCCRQRKLCNQKASFGV